MSSPAFLRNPNKRTRCFDQEDEDGFECRGSRGSAASAQPRGVLILPGLGNSSADYGTLAERLTHRGFEVEIAPVNRADWLRNAAGLIDAKYWRGNLEPRPTVDWCARIMHGLCCPRHNRVAHSQYEAVHV
jgi:hypothetical protein